MRKRHHNIIKFPVELKVSKPPNLWHEILLHVHIRPVETGVQYVENEVNCIKF